MDGLSELLFGKVRAGILALLLGKPDEQFYVREIVRALNAGQGSVQRELKSLWQAGVISKLSQGNHVYYRANPECAVFGELRDIMIKTAGLADVMKQALTAADISIDLAFVYGSVAKGTATATSDVDLLIVSEEDNMKLHTELMKVEEKLGRPINYTVLTGDEFRRKRAEAGGFIERVLGGAIILILGTLDDI